MQIIKRNGEIATFYTDKIVNAVTKAMNETELGIDFDLALQIADEIYTEYDGTEATPSVEDVQDKVEELLAEYGRFDVAKRYIIYRQERQKSRDKGWETTDLQNDILTKKYFYEGEDFNAWVERVGKGSSPVKKMIRQKKFLPAGRILMGRGLNEKGIKVSYSNCFVIAAPKDNLESIFDTAKKMARTYSYGGGCGATLENLRPRGATVRNAAKSTSGAVSFMDLYSLTTGLIGQSARRGALMLSMPVTHPDIIEFVNVKTDLDKVTKANVSVMITDDFMETEKKDEMWHMKFVVEDSGEEIKRKTMARELLQLIAKNNWRMAEPGALFWDRVEKWHLNSENPNFKYSSTNPCQPLGEYILTKDGFRKIEDVQGEVTLKGRSFRSTEMFKTGRKQIYLVELENGTKIRMTDNHRISTKDGDKELKDLKVDDKVLVDYTPIYNIANGIQNNNNYEKGIILGWLVADGAIYNKDEKNGYISFSVGQNEFEIADHLTTLIKRYDKGFEFTPHSQKLETCKVGRIHAAANRNKLMTDLGIRSQDDKFNIDYYAMDQDMKLGFLRAIFTCDGSSRCEGISTLYSINNEFLHHIQRMLKEFGVYSTITLHNNAKSYTAKDGKIRNNSATYKIAIYDTAFKGIGFLTNYKNNTLSTKKDENSTVMKNKKKQLKIRSIEKDGVEDVYDITVDEIHHYNTNGLIVHNCGEKPLPEGGSCLLGSLNLAAYVENGRFNYSVFRQDVKYVTAYLDDVLTEGIPHLPLDEQKESVTKYRQLGIGVMGLADALIKLGMRYGSGESLLFSEAVAKVMINAALQESAIRAKSLGVYPAYSKEHVLKSPFLLEVATEETLAMVEQYGLRNAELLSIAPTGLN